MSGSDGVRGARVLVTGGSGLLGSHVCDALLAAGAGRITVLDNFLRGRRSHLDAAAARGPVQIQDGSITDDALVRRLVQEADYVCHLAALRVTRCVKEPEECFDVMVRATHTLLHAAAQAKVRKVLYASSVVVYGEPESLPIDERHPLNGGTFYGAAKVAGEQFCRALAKSAGLRYVTLRYFNMYGPRMSIEGDDTEVMIKWLDRLEAGQPPVIHGDGLSSIDWVNVRDAARASVIALESPVADDTFNVASGRGTTLRELLELLIELTGARVSPRFEPAPAAYVRPQRVGSPEKAKRVLGFEPRIGLREGLQELAAWYRQAKRAVTVS